jgi:hypothetical protein
VPLVRIDAHHFSPDTRAFIELLHRHAVRYLIVGGEAVIFHGRVRLTGDAVMVGEGSETPVPYIGIEDLARNKRAAGRPRDLDDLGYLTKRG